MEKVRWGIIGVGDVTEVKSGPGFQKAQNSELVAVMRRNGELAQDYAQRHNVPRWYDDADALINDPEVDAVYIATPPHVHKEYALRAAAAGKPVYSEKPMALTLAECQEMIAVCEEAEVPLWVAYYRRSLAKYIKVKELLDAGAIGEISVAVTQLHVLPTNVSADAVPWRFRPEIGGGGRFADMGSHTLDILDYFLGPIFNVAGNAINTNPVYPAEDNVTATYQFQNGAVGSGVWSFTSPVQLDETILYGSKGTIRFSSFDDTPMTMIRGEKAESFDLPFPQHVQQPFIQTIVDELTGRGTCPSHGKSAARTTAVIDQILEGYRSGD
ncbi:MAG: Gfo/Idh/MocA family oxidoreductase [Chloroflexota bacterium]